jgi:hypothetical protein
LDPSETSYYDKGDLKEPPHNNNANGKFHSHENAQSIMRMQYKTNPTKTAAATKATARSFT